jgi:hypothetical protein
MIVDDGESALKQSRRLDIRKQTLERNRFLSFVVRSNNIKLLQGFPSAITRRRPKKTKE